MNTPYAERKQGITYVFRSLAMNIQDKVPNSQKQETISSCNCFGLPNLITGPEL